ncbi:phosphoenolpyruvate--protein phosphotransferase [Glaciecola sp. XM2]|uniref:phosphoenolpyruvate--protein phosphotransferase n=1 Tax=Glaciecola sp. XM2 TaxID=1914931 RepID=UPI001BDF650E|nr:phosphoenolpyruvate--protein phosphotransferase [Glaciecola sp. XM2]MBT1452191.1 phosphoenolpyruvate--protein phosphotransferase [Glaciecola sp. XM2]
MLSSLKTIIQEVSQIPELDKALVRLVSMVKATMMVDSCSIYLSNYAERHLVLTATDGLDPDAVGKVKIGFYEGVIGLVGDREEPLNIEDAPSHPRYKHYPEVKEESYHAFIGTPIIYQRKVLGVITMQQKKARRFSEDEEAFLVTLAAQIALEIVNAQMRGNSAALDNGTPFEPRTVNGIPGSPGLAMGIGYAVNFKHDLAQFIPRKHKDVKEQITRYRNAVQMTRTQVRDLSADLSDKLPDDVRAIFQLYDQLLDANSLGREVEKEIHEGWDAGSSLKLVIDRYATRFRNMEDPYMRERAVDIVDLSNRILNNILYAGDDPSSLRVPDGPCILVAQEVSAPMLAEFPRDKLAGIISIKGSNNSHAAILARAMGVPAVMGLQRVSINALKANELFIDGYSGEVVMQLDEQVKQSYQVLIDEEEALQRKISVEGDLPCVTEDGQSMSLLVNAGLTANIEMEQFKQGEGVGLYRTEIPFMMRERFPSEREQYELYKSVLSTHPTKEITLRTLDVGGDKPLSYFPISEENPFLGWRGVRLTLDHPDIFLVQVRAMLRASIGLSNLHILLPMITSVSEVDDAKRLIKQAFLEVKEEASAENQMLSKPAVGVMLEVPSVLFILPQLAQRVDFFSVGTNDLTQYLLAVDRNNARVSSLYSSYHPSVLAALHQIQQGSLANKVPVTVCGELAGEPLGAVALMALGFRKLSMNAYSLRKINWVIRNTNMQELKALLPELMAKDDPEAVKSLLSKYLESKKLGGLVRAGG